MIWVLQDRYESPISIETKNVPVTPRLTSQWRFNDIIVTKTGFTDFRLKYADFRIFAKKSYQDAILMGCFANFKRK